MWQVISILKKTDVLSIEATILTFTVASAVAADRDSLIICWGDGQCEKIERTQEATLGARKQNGYT